jgi:hypothetical protein
LRRSEGAYGDWEIEGNLLVNRKHSYEIEITRLVELREDRISDWAMRMIEKEWCAMEEFIPAMQFALSDIPNSIDWEETSHALLEEAYEMIVDQEVARRTGTENGFRFSDLDMLEEEASFLKRVGWRPTKP